VRDELTSIQKCDLLHNCCGCSACVNICPVEAIVMVENKHGFYNPKVDKDKCIGCSKCLKVCQIDASYQFRHPKESKAILSNNEEIRKNSSSGGIFPLICDAFHKLYGDNCLFYGAIFDDNLNVVHCAEEYRNIYKFFGSKYVQSDMHTCFQEIKRALLDKKYVIFSGVGCQSLGLIKYLEEAKIEHEKLFIIDIICHGVPSAKMWREYRKLLEDTYQDKLANYKFRDKESGWRGLQLKAFFSNGITVSDGDVLKSYGRLFGSLALNHVCHSCKLARLERVGDITLGDGWGIECCIPDVDIEGGLSLCLINSEKGEYIIKQILSNVIEVPIHGNSYLQPQLQFPTQKSIRDYFFWKDYEAKGYAYVAKKYAFHDWKHKYMKKIYHLIMGIK